MVGNRRDPSGRSSSGQGAPYKPKAKSAAAQRESEGVIVPKMAADENTAGGKDPWGGHGGDEGKREGMAGKSGPNNPGGRKLNGSELLAKVIVGVKFIDGIMEKAA